MEVEEQDGGVRVKYLYICYNERNVSYFRNFEEGNISAENIKKGK